MKYRIFPLMLALLLALGACEPVKYADRYGFLPGKDALANTEALQRCLEGGGRIVVRKAGDYALCRTLLLDGGTDLSFKEGVVLDRAVGPDSVCARFVFLNRGALTREYDENISIRGLQIRCNGLERGQDIPTIVGMSCQVGFSMSSICGSRISRCWTCRRMISPSRSVPSKMPWWRMCTLRG